MTGDRRSEKEQGEAVREPEERAAQATEEAEAAEAMDAGSSAAAEMEAELAAARDRYLRLAAEFDNYRRRTERERSEGSVRAQAQLVQKLLEPLDDLQRVAHFSAENATADSLLEGIQMVERKLLRILESAGLEPVQAKGQRFDPERHEALMTTEAESAEEDETVGDVLQEGYEFKGVLLRPARVQVKKHQG